MGSTGDVHPFIAVPVGTAEEFDLLRQDSKPWNSWRGFETVIKGILRVTPSIYRSIQERYVPGNTIMAASGLAFGARIAQDSPRLLIAYAAFVFDVVVSIFNSRFNASRSLGRCR